MADNRTKAKKKADGQSPVSTQQNGGTSSGAPVANNQQGMILPDEMPREWLNQIKEVVKQGWKTVTISTVLGSSVIAAVVTFGGNYLLENRKAELEAIKLRQKETIEAYGALGKAVQKYKSDLGTAVMTFEYAVKKGDSSFFPNVDNAINTVALQIAEVNDSLEDVRISDEAIKKKTEDSLSELPELLDAAEHDKGVLPKIIELYKDKLDRMLEELKISIEAKRTSVPLNP